MIPVTIYGYLNNANPEFLWCLGEGNSVHSTARTADGTKHSVLKKPPPSGRSRARFSRLLPALALLLGAVGLFATAPVAAQAKTFSITERARAVEGTSASLTITLSEDAPAAGVPFTVGAGFSGSSTAEAVDVMSIASPVTVPGGTRTLSMAIPLTDDDMDEDEETFTVTIATTAAGWTKEGDGKDTAVVTIDDDDNAGVAFIGVNAQDGINQLPLHLNTPKTYQVVLTSRPVADVTIKVSARYTFAVSPTSHTFAASSANDWREPKEFTVTGVRTGAGQIWHTVISADRKYTSLTRTDWDPSNSLQSYVDPPLPTRLALRGDPMPAEGGGMVTVTATLDHPAPRDGTTVKLTPSGTATGEGTDYTLSSTTISIAGAQTTGTATIRVTDDSADDDGETIVLVASSANPALTSNTLTLTIEDNDDPAPEPLMASFERVPSAHDGKESFWFNARFSEAVGEDGVAPVASSFAVRGGRVKRVRRIEPGLWRVRIVPASWRDVTVTLASVPACDADGAVCTGDGRVLSNTVTATIGGPVRLRIKGGKAREGKDAGLDFAVTLNRAASQAVSVDYATTDGTATAGVDYTTTAGTLTFAPGETAKTVTVLILNDAIDEGKEKFTLRLSNPQGAYLRTMHREATGTIRNADPLQRAWLSRFGRTAATHVTDAVSDRLRGTPGQDSHLTIGGYRLPVRQPAAGPGGANNDARGTALLQGLAGMLGVEPTGAGTQPGPWRDQPDPRLGQSQSLNVDLRRLLLGSAFRLNLTGAADGAAPRLTAWGRFAGTTFDGQDGKLSLDGDVLTSTVGLDGTWDRLVLGLAVAHSRGTGGYVMRPNAGPARRGDLEQTLTSLHPYLRYAVTERLDVWGLAGYGWGDLDLAQQTGGTYETDAQLLMGAVGGRGILLPAADTGGFQLATRTDAMLTRTTSDAVTGLAAGEGDAHRLRVILEGSRAVTWADGRNLTPTLELGVRHDWGDAETGFGLELGGRVQYADPTLGLTVEGTVRALLAHEDSEYQEWGASGTIRLAPGPTGHGLSLTVAPTWGAAASGVDGLWTRQTTEGLAPATRQAQSGRLAADMGYGLPAPFDSGLLTPYAGTVVVADGQTRTYRLGTRLQMPGQGTTGLTVNLEGTRQEPGRSQPVNQGVRLQVGWSF